MKCDQFQHLNRSPCFHLINKHPTKSFTAICCLKKQMLWLNTKLMVILPKCISWGFPVRVSEKNPFLLASILNSHCKIDEHKEYRDPLRTREIWSMSHSRCQRKNKLQIDSCYGYVHLANQVTQNVCPLFWRLCIELRYIDLSMIIRTILY